MIDFYEIIEKWMSDRGLDQDIWPDVLVEAIEDLNQQIKASL